jgi:3alpha(or 20beta)-hydroxysteroid dehydrogenase
MDELDGRVALITGAARGQGRAEAELLVAKGAKVLLADILDDLGQAAAEELGDAARYVHLDISQEADWKRAVSAASDFWGGVDVLVNNAAIFSSSPITETAPAEFERMFRVNQFGTFLGMQAVIPGMKEQGRGSIINISSINGLVGTPETIAYTASKFAVRGMTKTAAAELGRHGIRVNAIFPGGVDTPLVRVPQGFEVDDIFRRQPIARIGRPEEIACAVLYLAGDSSSYCTGVELVIDGGLTVGPLVATE